MNESNKDRLIREYVRNVLLIELGDISGSGIEAFGKAGKDIGGAIGKGAKGVASGLRKLLNIATHTVVVSMAPWYDQSGAGYDRIVKGGGWQSEDWKRAFEGMAKGGAIPIVLGDPGLATHSTKGAAWAFAFAPLAFLLGAKGEGNIKENPENGIKAVKPLVQHDDLVFEEWKQMQSGTEETLQAGSIFGSNLILEALNVDDVIDFLQKNTTQDAVDKSELKQRMTKTARANIETEAQGWYEWAEEALEAVNAEEIEGLPKFGSVEQHLKKSPDLQALFEEDEALAINRLAIDWITSSHIPSKEKDYEATMEASQLGADSNFGQFYTKIHKETMTALEKLAATGRDNLKSGIEKAPEPETETETETADTPETA